MAYSIARWISGKSPKDGYVQRRLAAVLMADVVGYSALMNTDEVVALRAVKSAFSEIVEPSIEERGGRIVKTTGDGLLAEFSSAVDAVACAVCIQQRMAAGSAANQFGKPLTYRIGINIGDIIVEKHDIFGDGVNIAARVVGGRTLLRHPTSRSTTPSVEQAWRMYRGSGTAQD